MAPKITIIGHVCIDENTVDDERSVRWGSPLLYMADYFIKKHNIRPVLIAPYGKDLAEYADVSLLLNKPTRFKTLRYRNHIRQNSRNQSSINILGAKPSALTPQIKQALKKTDILIFAPLLPNYQSSFFEVIEGCLPPKCVKVILPQGYFREVKPGKPITRRMFSEYADILSYFDVLIQSDEDIDNSEDKAQDWSRQFPNLQAIVTRNKRGSINFANGLSNETTTVSASDREIKNPVGAGDIFSASVSYYFHQSGDINASILKAHQDTYESLTR